MSSVLARSSLWSRAKEIPMKYPMGFGIVLSGFKTSFSDILVQKVVERKEKMDWRRNAAFATFGFVYLGGVQYMIYVKAFSRLFPNAAAFAAKSIAEKLKDVKGMGSLAAQLFLDQCIHHPVLYFPAFYCTKELVMSDKPDFQKVLADYRRNMKEDMFALWKIWVPATFINFAFMPMHLRIPYVACISLVWSMILSAMRGGDVVHADDMVLGGVTGATYQLLREGLDEFNTTPVELDYNLSHLNISAVGKQRPGLVALLARHISDQGGNVTESKMARLGQEFIMQMHVAVPHDKREALLKSLKTKQLTQELDIQATRLSRRETKHGQNKAVMGMKIHCIGADRPGMLAAVAEKAAEKGMSIEDISTNLRVGRNGEREFIIDALISSPNLSDKDNLDACIADVSKLKEELNLTKFDVRVHTN